MESKYIMPSVSLVERFMLDAAKGAKQANLGIENIQQILRFGTRVVKEGYEVFEAFEEKQSWFKRVKEIFDLSPLALEATVMNVTVATAWLEIGDLTEEEFTVLSNDIANVIPSFNSKPLTEQKQYVRDLLEWLYGSYQIYLSTKYMLGK